MILRINKNDMLLIWEALVGHKGGLESCGLRFGADQIALVKKFCKQTGKEYQKELWEDLEECNHVWETHEDSIGVYIFNKCVKCGEIIKVVNMICMMENIKMMKSWNENMYCEKHNKPISIEMFYTKECSICDSNKLKRQDLRR